MSDADKPVLTGGCQCGAVRYALRAPPEPAHLCHDRDCQKALGGPFAALAPLRRGDFVWARGTAGNFARCSIAHRDFAVQCGTPLSFRYDDSEWISVTIVSIDRPQAVWPTKHMGVQSRLDWLDTLDGLSIETTDAVMSAAHRRKNLNYQHPNHASPADWVPHK
jgi:hypothetical protein